MGLLLVLPVYKSREDGPDFLNSDGKDGCWGCCGRLFWRRAAPAAVVKKKIWDSRGPLASLDRAHFYVSVSNEPFPLRGASARSRKYHFPNFRKARVLKIGAFSHPLPPQTSHRFFSCCGCSPILERCCCCCRDQRPASYSSRQQGSWNERSSTYREQRGLEGGANEIILAPSERIWTNAAVFTSTTQFPLDSTSKNHSRPTNPTTRLEQHRSIDRERCQSERSKEKESQYLFCITASGVPGQRNKPSLILYSSQESILRLSRRCCH